MRIGKCSRKTSETDIEVEVNLDGEGKFTGTSGISFLDHMLGALAKHSKVDISIISCTGDLDVDYHHTVEDLGIVIGNAFLKALGEKRGIKRFGFGSVPMDEALSQASIDISGREFFYITKDVLNGSIKDFDMELIEVFFSGFVRESRIALHLDIVRGVNKHHIAESIFKSFAVALRESIKIEDNSIPSTKGVI